MLCEHAVKFFKDFVRCMIFWTSRRGFCLCVSALNFEVNQCRETGETGVMSFPVGGYIVENARGGNFFLVQITRFLHCCC